MNRSSAAAGWEHFPHDADIGVRGFGPTREAAFAEAARALTAVITDPDSVAARESVTVACEAGDDDTLLYDWLNAIVYEMATRDMLFASFEIEATAGGLQATLRGERVVRERHSPAAEIKGATYTGLSVRREQGGRWIAECVVDV